MPERQTIRAESPTEAAMIVVDHLRRSGYVIPDEAIAHIEREISAELLKLHAGAKVSEMVAYQVGPLLDQIARISLPDLG